MAIREMKSNFNKALLFFSDTGVRLIVCLSITSEKSNEFLICDKQVKAL